MPPEVWEKYGIDKAKLKPFMCPDYKTVKNNKTEIHFFGYYKLGIRRKIFIM